MPTYSYKCTECGTAFDIHQEFTDDSLTVCPNCGGKLRKVFTAVGVTFNGSGFYRTDSRAGASGSSSGSSADSSGGSSVGSKSGESSSSSDSSSGSTASPTKSSESKQSAASTKPSAPSPSTTAG